MRSVRKLAAGLMVVGSVAALSACGSGKKTTSTISFGSPRTVAVYSSLPLVGASASQATPLVNGIKLALAQAHNRAGEFTIKYTSLNDATAAAGEWDPIQTAANARRAAADPDTVYYIGEFNSGASEISIPILNLAGIPQVSPANTYVGLTVSAGVSASASKYDPTGKANYVRIVPIDSIQAAADLLAMKQAGCTKVAVADDGQADGAGLAMLLRLEESDYGIDIVSDTAIDPKATDFRAYAAMIKSKGVRCFEFSGIVANGGVPITEAVNSALPNATILGSDGMCTSSWTNAADGGVPASVDPKLECTVATPDLAAYPKGSKFLSAYRAMYGVSDPDPYAAYGYEAMELGLSTIASLGPDGNNKADVLKALFAIKSRNSVLGTYGFDSRGDTTLKSYYLYRVGKNGDPVFYRTLTPTRVLGRSS